MFGWGKLEHADREIEEVTALILGQSLVQGANFPPEGCFENELQMAVALEACAFFLQAVDRLAHRAGNERLRKAVFDTTARQMVRTFSDMIFKAWAPSPFSEIEQDILDFFNTRQLQLSKAAHLVSNAFNDLNSASWLAAHNIARAAEIEVPDIRIAMFHMGLLDSLVAMDIANRFKKIESLLA